MVTLFVRHKVADYAAWRKVYDAFQASSGTKDVIGQSVYISADDPTDITVTHDFKTLDIARAFTASEALHSTMGKAGVVGAPTVWFASKA